MLISAIPLVFFFAQSPATKAACTLTSGTWSVSSVTVTQPTTLTVNSSGCGSRNVDLQVFVKKSSGTTSLIRNIPGGFSTSGGTIQLIFTTADMGGDPGPVTITVEAKASDGSSNTVTSQPLTLSAAPNTTGITVNFDAMQGISPKIIPSNNQVNVIAAVTINVANFGSYCGDPNTSSFRWSVYEIYPNSTFDKAIWPTGSVLGQEVSFDRSAATVVKTVTATVSIISYPSDSTLTQVPIYTVIECPTGNSVGVHKNASQSAAIPLIRGTGNLTYNCAVADSRSSSGYTYACSPGNLSNCSDVPQCGGKCSGQQIPVSLCGSPAPNPNTGGGGTNNGNGASTGTTGETKSYSFSLFNPLCQGDSSSCPQNIFDVFDIVSTWIVNISIPIAVILILWAGFKMLTSGGVPANVQQGKKIITYVVLGLVIIFIGKGFISLIYSILNLGSGSSTTQDTTGVNGPNTSGAVCSGNAYVLGNQVIGSCANGFAVCVGGKEYSNTGAATGASCSDTCGAGGLCQNGILNDQGTGIKSCTRDSDCAPKSAGVGLGYACSTTSDCVSGLVCDNTLCKRPGGNAIGEACLNTQCAQGLACDNTTAASVQINNRTVGTCYQPLCNQDLHKCINNSNITCSSSADCQ